MPSSFPTSAKLAMVDALCPSASAIRLALYATAAALDATTTAYTTANETTGTGYTPGGITLAGLNTTTSGTTAFADWTDATFSTVTIAFQFGLIYDDDDTGDRSILTLDFGAQNVTGINVVVQWPAADASNAILRVA